MQGQKTKAQLEQETKQQQKEKELTEQTEHALATQLAKMNIQQLSDEVPQYVCL